mmetsp:Transcript_41004/g.80266  ORF Transcript_41004/g.80266 Transcript_41004/m.80266 type:complete len:128 (-) Transcript_41004:165-548(-)
MKRANRSLRRLRSRRRGIHDKSIIHRKGLPKWQTITLNFKFAQKKESANGICSAKKRIINITLTSHCGPYLIFQYQVSSTRLKLSSIPPQKINSSGIFTECSFKHYLFYRFLNFFEIFSKRFLSRVF